MDRAGAQDDFAALDVGPSIARAHANSHRALAVKLDAVDQGVADDAEIRTLARRFEVAVVGRDARVVAAVHRIRRHSGAGRSVVVLAPSVALVEANVAQRAVGAAPSILRRAPDWNRAAASVIRE